MLGFGIAKQKYIFPVSGNEISSVEKCIHQARYVKTKQNKTVKGALIIAHFQEDQTKYQPSQTHSHICKDPHPKKAKQLDEISEISAVYAVVCQIPGKYSLKKLEESTCWKKIVSSA